MSQILYDETTLAAVLNEFELRAPLKYRTLLVQCADVRNTHGKPALIEVLREFVALRYDACAHAHEMIEYGYYAYACAMALDDSRVMRLPLRSYDIERCAARLRAETGAVALPLKYTESDFKRLHPLYAGELITAVNLRAHKDPAITDIEINHHLTEHGGLRAAFGATLTTLGSARSGGKRWDA